MLSVNLHIIFYFCSTEVKKNIYIYIYIYIYSFLVLAKIPVASVSIFVFPCSWPDGWHQDCGIYQLTSIFISVM